MGESPICMMWWTHPSTTKQHEILAHIPNGEIEDVAIETLNPFMKGEFASTFQVEGARISP
jgi:hypothetical protein